MFYKKDKKVIIQNSEEKPEISFYNATAYDITTSGLKEVIRSTEAYMYKTREELVNGTIISKGDTNNSANIINGDHFLKIKNQLYIDGNVHLQLENNIEIATEQLEYNTATKIAKNNLPFEATQYDHTYKGTNLYMSLVDKYIRSNDTKMKIKVSDE